MKSTASIAQHTPGPWRMDETIHHNLAPGRGSRRTFEVFTDADIRTHRHIATVEARDGQALGSVLVESEGAANARLIAGAPRLYAAGDRLLRAIIAHELVDGGSDDAAETWAALVDAKAEMQGALDSITAGAR